MPICNLLDLCLFVYLVQVSENWKIVSWNFGSYTLAIEFQQQVVDGWESHGPSAEDELRDAQQFLRQLKKKAVGLNSNEPLSKPSPLPQTSSSSS